MQAVLGDRAIKLGSPQQQAMLAVLLLRPHHTASMQELIDAVWGEDPPHSAAATIRTYAWRLRQVFDESGGRSRTLMSVGDGYRLALGDRYVDAPRAEQLAAQAVEHRAAGRLAEAGRRIGQALALWRGEPLIGVPGPYAEQQRRRLDELRLTLLEERFDIAIRQGLSGLVIPELGSLTSVHPLRERFHASYMRALHAAGRQADALTAYQRLRRHLVAELGIEPTRELRDLYQAILVEEQAAGAPPGTGSVPPHEHGDRRESGQGPADRPARGPGKRAIEVARRPLPARLFDSPGGRPGQPTPGTAADDRNGGEIAQRTGAPLSEHAAHEPVPAAPGGNVDGPPVPAQLPAGATDFTGRAAELAVLEKALTADHRDAPQVAVITGMGGVGKTAVALQAAHRARGRFQDGQLYADLRGTQPDPADPGVLLTSFITALGVPARSVPESLEDRAGLLRSLLDGRRVLMVLDNVRDTTQIGPLLPGAATCAVLITSRSRLWGLPTSARIDLLGFETDDAVSLLERIVGAARVAENPVAARELVQNCGLLPLAVRIAASRLAARPTWGAASLTARLGNERRRIAELRAGDLSVAAVFEVGYRQLGAVDARAFRMIATVCDPEIGLPAAAAVLGVDEEVVDEQLESLVDASLLDTSRPGRYQIHDLLRVFGQQRATAAERLLALDRLLDFLLATATGAFRRAVPGDAVAATLRPTRTAGLRLDDVHTARAWVAAEWEGAFSAVLAAVREAYAAGPSAEDTSLLRASVDLLIAMTPFGPYVQRERLAWAASAVAEAAHAQGDRRTVGRARFLCGNIAVHGTRLAHAKEHLRVAEDHCRETEDLPILCQTLNDLGLTALFEHRYADAVDRLDEAVLLSRKLGQRSGELVATVNVALARLHHGRAEEAREECEGALTALRATGDQQGVAYALLVLGICLHGLGRYEDAVARYTECLRVCRKTELHGREAQANYRLADTLRAMGRTTEAVAAAERAVDRCTDGTSERDRAHALVALGRALADIGRTRGAVARLDEAAALFARLGLPDVVDVWGLREGLRGQDLS